MIVKHAKRKPGTRDQLSGLVAYLAGPGRDEEHTNPRVVAGWSEDWTNLPLGDPQAQWELVDQMTWPARAFELSAPREGFTYHVPISLHADDGQLSDEQWAYVARKAIAELGFEGCRWVAVHHGLGASGEGPRDHLHLVVHRAREDGTVASISNDFRAMARVRAEMEDDPTLGLTVTTQRQGGGRSGWTQGERARARREGRAETDRERLELLVRATVGPAESEAEWVRSMREAGIVVRPRYAEGGRDAVVGYSVALPPQQSETRQQRPQWFGGGKLAKDLTLSSIRQRWDGHDPAESLHAWATTAAPAQRQERQSVWPQAQQALDDYLHALQAIPVSDRELWRMVSRETSEALAGLATRAPSGERAELARAARRLSRAAETPDRERRGQPSRGSSAMRTACRIIADAALAGQSGTAAVGMLAHQLVELIGTIRQANESCRDAAAARQATLAKASLLAMDQRLNRSSAPAHPARLAAMASPVSPTPQRGTPAPRPVRDRPGTHQPQPGSDADRGHER